MNKKDYSVVKVLWKIKSRRMELIPRNGMLIEKMKKTLRVNHIYITVSPAILFASELWPSETKEENGSVMAQRCYGNIGACAHPNEENPEHSCVN